VKFSRSFLELIFALALSFSAWASDLPNPAITPGAINPKVTQANMWIADQNILKITFYVRFSEI